jgi:ribonuclease PH
VDGEMLLDLCYQEDSAAAVDFNIVMTREGKLVELQGTAEGAPFGPEIVPAMLDLAYAGIGNLFDLQRQVL